jgi:cell division protein FtsL
MIKLLICLACGMAMAVVMLQLRQQELELRHQAADLQIKIQNHQAKLWQQQLEIAVYTAPNAVNKFVQQQDLKLVPEASLPLAAGDWVGSTPQQIQPVARR